LIKKQQISEDEVLHLVAEFLIIRGFRILAFGANQAGLFRFPTSSGRHKAPDLVAYLEPILLICEAKVRSSNLFRKPLGRLSDYEYMIELARSPLAHAKLEDESKRVLQALGITPPNVIVIKVGLIAATPFLRLTTLPPSDEVLFFELDPITECVSVQRDVNCCIPP
jgi:hypothetical protein